MTSLAAPLIVKRGYNRRWLQLGLYCFIVGIAVGLFNMAFAWFVRIPEPDLTDRALEAINKFNQCLQGFLLLTIGCSNSVLLRRSLRRNEQRDHLRQLAANGDQQEVHLAQEQPKPYAGQLSLPLTVRSFMTVGSTLLWSAILFVLVTLVAAISIILTPDVLSSKISFATVITVIDIFVFLTLLIFILIGVTARRQITITDMGITVKNPGRPHTVLWNEAKLFSLPHTTSNANEIWEFELASANAIVTWAYVQKPGWINRASTMPYEEYNRLIDAINSYVMMRTGLSLYDLRK